MVIMLLVYLSYFFVSQTLSMHRISANINTEKHTAEKLKEEQDNLDDKVEMAKTDKYKEVLARELLNLIKDGETPVIDSQKK